MIYHDKDTPKKAADCERYYWYKEHGICTICGQNEVYLPRSTTMCLQCLEDVKERHKNREKSTEQKYKEKIYARRYYDLCAAFGVCTVCKKRDASKDHVLCSTCLAKRRKEYEKSVVKKALYQWDFIRLQFVCIVIKKSPITARSFATNAMIRQPEHVKKQCKNETIKITTGNQITKLLFMGGITHEI